MCRGLACCGCYCFESYSYFDMQMTLNGLSSYFGRDPKQMVKEVVGRAPGPWINRRKALIALADRLDPNPNPAKPVQDQPKLQPPILLSGPPKDGDLSEGNKIYISEEYYNLDDVVEVVKKLATYFESLQFLVKNKDKIIGSSQEKGHVGLQKLLILTQRLFPEAYIKQNAKVVPKDCAVVDGNQVHIGEKELHYKAFIAVRDTDAGLRGDGTVEVVYDGKTYTMDLETYHAALRVHSGDIYKDWDKPKDEA